MKFDKELVSGSITRSVWKLAWPVVLLNLVNGLHGFVDHALVGHFVGSDGNAGVGVAWHVFLVFVVFISSLYHGMSVLVARYAGKKDRETLSEVAYHCFLTSVYILLALGIIGFTFSPSLLKLANAGPDVMVHALPYIRIMFLCGMPLFFMFMLAGAMQASGDPRTPLILGVMATLLNVVLSIILITGIGPFPKLGTAGAAIATCVAPFATSLIGFGLILNKRTIIHPPRRWTLLPNLRVVWGAARIGIPTGIQSVMLNGAGVVILYYLGSLEDGGEAQAAYSICYAQLFSLTTWACWGLRNASSTIMGQNIGAGDLDRGRSGVHVAAAFGVVWALLLGSLYMFAPGALLRIFDVTGGPVLEFGSSFLRILTFSGVSLGITLAYTGGLVGAGETRKPMLIAFVSQVLLLVGLCQTFRSMGILTANTVWLSILAGHVTRLILTLIVFRGRRWERLTVELHE
ncbi:MAG: MATE family efflux transporter [bacterium]|nr:MATE family efflux transporter [bacterium]